MIHRLIVLALSWGTLLIVPRQPSNLPPQRLPVYGGTGGVAFTRSCGAGKVLTGLRFRTGQLVDAVGVLCRPVFSDGTLGPETTVGTLVGGGGGTAGSRSCSRGKVLVSATIQYGSFVDGIFFWCRQWDATSRKVVGTEEQNLGGVIGGTGGTRATELCEAVTQPANAIRGRAHSLVDAVGFVCDEP